jgi:hypothetical protein
MKNLKLAALYVAYGALSILYWLSVALQLKSGVGLALPHETDDRIEPID